MQRARAWENIRGLTFVSLCDWPGKVSAVLFTGGCNLRCPTCHNAGLAWRPDRHPALGRDTIMGYLDSRALWLDGVTVTGGEPTVCEGIDEVLGDVAGLGLPVKLDSNGQRPEVLRDLLGAGLAQTFAVDVKGPFAKYPALTGGGVSEDQARANMAEVFQLAAAHPMRFYFRTTLVPELTEQDMQEVRALLPSGFSITEQTYVPPGRSSNAQADSEERRMSGDLVQGAHSRRHTQGAQGGRQQRPALVHAAGA
jgi:pyruvate formate lyase activating enzyme